MNIKEIFQKATDEELKQAYTELNDWMNTGILINDGIVRKFQKQVEGLLESDYILRSIERDILWEIGYRFSK